MQNRRIVVTERGGPDVLKVVEEQLPEPGPDEVRLKVLAAGVSAFDLMVRHGSFPGFPKPPFTPGCDVVGIVDQLGDKVSTLDPGQMVAGGPFFEGGYSEYLCLPAEGLVPVPDGVDPAEAVCLVANYLTAHLEMHGVARVKSGERVLIHGAAGGVGSALLELGRMAGLEMYGTASKHNHEFVSSMGATPIDYRAEDFVERVRALTGEGVDVVFDPIGGGRQLWRSYRALRKGGRLVWFGVAASSKAGMKVIPASFFTRLALSLLPDGKHAPLTPNAGKVEQAETLADLLDLLAAGKINPEIAERIPLEDAVRAHEFLEQGGYRGKVVLVTNN